MTMTALSVDQAINGGSVTRISTEITSVLEGQPFHPTAPSPIIGSVGPLQVILLDTPYHQLQSKYIIMILLEAWVHWPPPTSLVDTAPVKMITIVPVWSPAKTIVEEIPICINRNII